MNKKKIKISLVLNIIIIILVLVASTIMFAGFKFMNGKEIILETTKMGMFKFFTVDSNIFMGIVALLFVVKEIKVLNGKSNEISKVDYILKLMGTSGVALTFIIVFAYLGPISKDGIVSMLMNSNLFFHLIIPVISIASFVIIERTEKIDFKYSIYGIIPTVIYGLFYLINILIHMENGKVSFDYDWYWFVQNGVWTALIVMPIILIISYIISLSLWKLNRVKEVK